MKSAVPLLFGKQALQRPVYLFEKLAIISGNFAVPPFPSGGVLYQIEYLLHPDIPGVAELFKDMVAGHLSGKKKPAFPKEPSVRYALVLALTTRGKTGDQATDNTAARD